MAKNTRKRVSFCFISRTSTFFENKRVKNTKKNLPLPRSNIFLNKCYTKKPILLDLPKITSICVEIKGKHRCIGGVTFVSCCWRHLHYARREEM